jgi:hypothetical protein
MKPPYWIDSNVLIQAKNGPYDFDRVPQFWTFISKEIENGRIKAPKFVYDELTGATDWLANWCKQRKKDGLCENASRDVQQAYSDIANYVQANYTAHQAAVFLRGADGWVIAHAMVDGGTVVTHESDKSKKSKVKIPAICRQFGVTCLNTYEMNKELDFRVA